MQAQPTLAIELYAIINYMPSDVQNYITLGQQTTEAEAIVFKYAVLLLVHITEAYARVVPCYAARLYILTW